ncbi:MAG: hypothetical protein IJP31_01715 [Lachnospiraceae bacterium]|nr:hypothetical protein [Lachnospiraceae bacterium]
MKKLLQFVENRDSAKGMKEQIERMLFVQPGICAGAQSPCDSGAAKAAE